VDTGREDTVGREDTGEIGKEDTGEIGMEDIEVEEEEGDVEELLIKTVAIANKIMTALNNKNQSISIVTGG